jgi:hypothetical protein
MVPELERPPARNPAPGTEAPGTSVDQVVGLKLDGHGMVCDWDSACETLFGHRRSEIVSRHVSTLLPQLADVQLIEGGEPNSRLRYLCRIGVRFQALSRSGERFPCDLFLNTLGSPGGSHLRLIVCAAPDEAGCPKR